MNISGPFPLANVIFCNGLPFIITSKEAPFHPSPNESYSSNVKLPQVPIGPGGGGGKLWHAIIPKVLTGSTLAVNPNSP